VGQRVYLIGEKNITLTHISMGIVHASLAQIMTVYWTNFAKWNVIPNLVKGQVQVVDYVQNKMSCILMITFLQSCPLSKNKFVTIKV
jgi:hypothetical protein